MAPPEYDDSSGSAAHYGHTLDVSTTTLWRKIRHCVVVFRSCRCYSCDMETPRALESRLRELLTEAPVVVLVGARQAGKSTLVQKLMQTDPFSGAYFSLDELTVLNAARSDPEGFIEGLSGGGADPVAIDEVQRAPDLLLAIKASVDQDRRPGRFLLTGSADPSTLPKVAGALAGRMRVVELWPMSAGEALRHGGRLLDVLLDGLIPRRTPCWTCGFAVRSDGTCHVCGKGPRVAIEAVVDKVVRGGFPEVVLTRDWSTRARADWFASYAQGVLQRQLADLTQVDVLDTPARLLRLMSTRVSTVLNLANVARDARAPQSTLKRHLGLLQQVFLVHLLGPWSNNLGKRLVKKPKVHLVDTGLAANLMGADAERLLTDRALLGPLLESYVATELWKQAGLSAATIHHLRGHDQREVDILIEAPDGRVVAVEVKSAATVTPSDLSGLRFLEDALGDRFVAGVVLYLGRRAVPFGRKLHALPLSLLWAADEILDEARGG